MSAHPAYTMFGVCAVGGVTGFIRTGSVPSLVAGLGVGALYGWSGYQIQQGDPAAGLQGAFAASLILLASSAPRARKGPVPLVLSLSSAAAAAYYGKTLRELGIFPF